MKVDQIYEIANELGKVYLGEKAITVVDASTLVDMGKAVIDLDNLDRYVNALIDRIGRVEFVSRVYGGTMPSLLMKDWEYGAILEKIGMAELPDAERNETYNLVDRQSYDPNIFYQPKVMAKFFSKAETFDIPMSFAHEQIKTAFTTAGEINSFFAMIENGINRSMTAKTEGIAQMALNTFMAAIFADNSTNAGMRRVNLLSGYNTRYSKTLAAADAVTDPDFIRYATYIMRLYKKRMERLSVHFNIGGYDRFTPSSDSRLIWLSEFKEAASTFLYSGTYHDDYVHVMDGDSVPFWQGSGVGYDFASTSSIKVTLPHDISQQGTTIEQSGILAVMFDREAVSACNLRRWVTSNYNGRAEFYNNWYKWKIGYFVDTNEQGIVFYVEDPSEPAD